MPGKPHDPCRINPLSQLSAGNQGELQLRYQPVRLPNDSDANGSHDQTFLVIISVASFFC